MTIELQTASEDDKSYLLRLRKLTMADSFEKAGLYLTDEEHDFRLNDEFECMYLIWFSGERVGAVKYREFESKFELMQLQIDPEHQGRGIGKRIVERIKGWGEEKCKTVELSVLKNNPAIDLYARLGFVVVGEDEFELYMEFTR
jgi:ribosomal protein S18 acetylase RimI-like enzyme